MTEMAERIRAAVQPCPAMHELSRDAGLFVVDHPILRATAFNLLIYHISTCKRCQGNAERLSVLAREEYSQRERNRPKG